MAPMHVADCGTRAFAQRRRAARRGTADAVSAPGRWRMVPMIDPMIPAMIPEATVLLMVTPSLVGVLLAFLVAVAVAIIGTHHELGKTEPPRSPKPRPTRRPQPAAQPA